MSSLLDIAVGLADKISTDNHNPSFMTQQLSNFLLNSSIGIGREELVQKSPN